MPGKVDIFLTRIQDPQISNQIDAAERTGVFIKSWELDFVFMPILLKQKTKLQTKG